MSQSERHAPGHALVIGGGTMGVGIIAMFLAGGWKVDVVSRSAATREGLAAACAKALAAMGKPTGTAGLATFATLPTVRAHRPSPRSWSPPRSPSR
jgi:3-hydroxybutyryl-CoA dehydrogenase